MTSRVGMGLPNGPGYLDTIRDIPLGVVFIIDGDWADEQIRQIREWQPRTRIVMRRLGGIGNRSDQLVDEVAARYRVLYQRFGVTEWCFWNEPDRREEGGFSARYVADYARAFAPLARAAMPGLRLHFGAWADEARFQDPDQWVWLPVVLDLYDVLDLHAYGPGYVRTYLEWAAARLPETPVLITEFNARPYGDAVQFLDAYRTAADFPNCEGVCPFILYWHNPEPMYGDALSLAVQPALLDAVRQAAAEQQVAAPETEEVSTPHQRVMGVICRDTGRDITDLINAAAAEHSFDPVGFLGGLIQESGLREHAARERAWPDVSYGLSQPAVKWFRGLEGLDKAPDGTNADTPTNRRRVRDWCFDAAHLIPYTAPTYAYYLRTYGGGTDAAEAWARWNKPAIPGDANPAKAHYAARIAEAEAYRVRSEDPPIEEPTPMFVYNYTRFRGGRRPETRGVFIHSTRSGRNQSLAAEYTGTVNYFLTSGKASAQALIGPTEGTIMVPNTDQAWHAGIDRDRFPNHGHLDANQTHLGIEVCQPRPGDDFTDFQYQATALLCRIWAEKYGFPLRRVWSQFEPGLIGHEDSEQGRLYGKSDPGAHWDWDYFLSLCAPGPAEPVAEPAALTRQQALDEIWRIGQLLIDGEQLGPAEGETLQHMAVAAKDEV